MSICRLQQYHHLIEGQVIFLGGDKKWHIEMHHFLSVLKRNFSYFFKSARSNKTLAASVTKVSSSGSAGL